jgi:hypothetical protein
MAEIDFDEWIKDFKVPEIKFFAVFDPKTFAVTGVYPEHALSETVNFTEIDREIAESINEGKIQLHSCFVDASSGKFEIAELTNLTKIDDVLHRVIDKQWSTFDDPDVFIVHNSNDKTLKFELSSKYRGTRKSASDIHRTIRWASGTEMTFLITTYNDPNMIKATIKFSIDDLIGNSKVIDNITLPAKFSIYTKRLFPAYVLETE